MYGIFVVYLWYICGMFLNPGQLTILNSTQATKNAQNFY